MDSVRCELIKILKTPIFPHELADPHEAVADYLLDNGVTVQRWIPVAERKPGNIEERVLVKVRADSVAGYPAMDTDRYVLDGWVRYGNRVTHWTPLPVAPKEDA